ncbi:MULTISPECIES: thioredoxin family protein [unclassified Fusibacter]|uniref:protein disulfide oxidoreductase n=1 Tax=unclassified Fusibacter TaxID=2624464 RepID=UPI0010126535|nr:MULTISPECIES: thioredoxin family protein [unclassified Fusibacter]MCK8059372.1 thioredoxin family protein [Fusibacter sp. A2]NPE21164.1 glutaredoxin [Fusibacter sp. A1]RXV62432.1 glutaredoxin [Fusibacter sp. A1]
MSLLNQEIKDQLKDHFTVIKKEVNMHLFVNDCDSCDDTKSLLEDVSGLSDKINLNIADLKSEEAAKFSINQAPVIMFTDDKGEDLRIRFNGIPAGHEFSAFITTLTEVGDGGEVLPDELISRVNSVEKPVDIKVFVTLSCPHCSGAVAKAHKLALMNPNIKAEMIECGTFPELADKYNVSGVPKIVINETNELVGNQPIDMFLDTIDKL